MLRNFSFSFLQSNSNLSLEYSRTVNMYTIYTQCMQLCFHVYVTHPLNTRKSFQNRVCISFLIDLCAVHAYTSEQLISNPCSTKMQETCLIWNLYMQDISVMHFPSTCFCSNCSLRKMCVLLVCSHYVLTVK